MLRRWGEGLGRDEREELRAAGRAIVLLSDEIERLHVALSQTHQQHVTASAEPAPVASDWPRASAQQEIGTALRERIMAFRLRDRD